MTLKERRTALGLTQEALARLLGISSRTWVRWERACPYATLIDLALTEIERRTRDEH